MKPCRMKLSILVATLLPCILVAQDIKYPASYLILAPRTIRPGLLFTLDVDIRQATGPVTVTAQIRDQSSDGPPVQQGSTSATQGTEARLELQIPADLGPPMGQYLLEVKGEGGGISFNETKNLAFSVTHFAIFIQTDKAIYKPGQTVNYRVLGVHPGMAPYIGEFDIQIKDANDNVISLMTGVRNDTYGVVTKAMVMSSEPVLGDWKIIATAEGQEKTQVFTVEEYVLPKFDVEVMLPSFLSGVKDSLTVTIDTKYTYGKPVDGSAAIIVSFLYYDKQLKTDVEVKDGTASASFTYEELRRLFTSSISYSTDKIHSGTVINATAVVTEKLTGLSQTSSSTVTYYSKKIKVEALPTMSTIYKPGLRFLVQLKFSYQDGTSLTPSELREGYCLEFQVFVTPEVDKSRICSTIPETGVVEVPLDVPAGGYSASFKVYYYQKSTIEESRSDYDYTQYLTQMDSPSQTYLQIHLDTKQVQVDEDVSLEIVTTEDPIKLTYTVIAQSSIMHTASVPGTGLSTTIMFRVTPDMTPNARILVSFVTATGEVVVDSVELKVKGAFRNQVDVSFNKNVSEPGDDIEFSVEASPNSLVGILAVDQSVLILKSGNDITQEQVIEDLSAIDTVDSSGGGYRGDIRFRKKRDVYWPRYSWSNSAKQIYSNAGLLVFSDALVPGYDSQVFYADDMIFEAAPAAGADEVDSDVSNKIPPQADMLPRAGEVTVRKEFPETWLWFDAVTDDNGHVTFSTRVPDTITSWLGSAFAVSLTSGLGVSPDPVKTTVFKPFFVSLNLPYSVIRHETLILQATVFNYFDVNLTATVSLKKDSYYEAITMENGIEKATQSGMSQTVKVTAQAGATVSFPIKIVKAGLVNLEVRAETHKAVDTVRRQLLVEFEGTPKALPESRLFSSDAITDIEETFIIADPRGDFIIDGSMRVVLSVTGDLLGATMSNLDSLLKMPYGCGEQNMMNFAPDVFVYKYLTVTKRDSPAIEEKALRYMITGYQRELTYRHDDGSFSAFGSQDKSGSVWLTAFVVRSFSGATDFIFIDPAVIDKAVNFILDQQQRNGVFTEPGRIVDIGINGGVNTPTGLAAYIAIALQEAVNGQAIKQATRTRAVSALSRVEAFLTQQLSDIEEQPFTMALVTYALAVLESREAGRFKEGLDKLAITDGGQRHWSDNSGEREQRPENPWLRVYNGPPAHDVEITAYALLAYLKMGERAEAISISRWLADQISDTGGYGSTQDTVVGLQALTEYALIVSQVDPQLNLEVTLSNDPTFTRNIVINNDNSIVLHQVELPAEPGTVTLRGRGKGTCLMKFTISYHSAISDDPKSFEYTISVEEGRGDQNRIEIEACGRYIGDNEGTSMCLMDIGLLSGFSADTDELRNLVKNHQLVQKYETVQQSVYIYFQEIPKDKATCVMVYATRSNDVANVQPKYARLLDYYNPAEQAVVKYTSDYLQDTSVCDICRDCAGCSSGHRQPFLSVALLVATLLIAVFIGSA